MMLDKLKALASAERLTIVMMLNDAGAHNVTEIADAIELSQSATSQHLAKLRNAGIIEAEPRGNAVYYSINHGGVWFTKLQDALR